jgi:hypothetical protein
METTKKKPTASKKARTIKKNLPEKKEKRVSQTWIAFMEACKNPGEILDMEAVLK